MERATRRTGVMSLVTLHVYDITNTQYEAANASISRAKAGATVAQLIKTPPGASRAANPSGPKRAARVRSALSTTEIAICAVGLVGSSAWPPASSASFMR